MHVVILALISPALAQDTEAPQTADLESLARSIHISLLFEICMVAGALAGVSLLLYLAATHKKKWRIRELILEDNLGRDRGVLSTVEEEDGSPIFMLLDRESRPGVIVSQVESGWALCLCDGGEDQVRVRITVNLDGPGPLVCLSDEEGRPRIQAWALSETASVDVMDHNESAVGTLYAEQDEDGSVVGILSVDDITGVGGKGIG